MTTLLSFPPASLYAIRNADAVIRLKGDTGNQLGPWTRWTLDTPISAAGGDVTISGTIESVDHLVSFVAAGHPYPPGGETVTGDFSFTFTPAADATYVDMKEQSGGAAVLTAFKVEQ